MILASLSPASGTLHFFVQGGFFMIPLILCSLASLAVIIWSVPALRRQMVMPAEIEERIENLRIDEEGDSINQLWKLVSKNASALARVTQTGLQHLEWPKSENSEAVQTRARHEIVRLERGLVVLEIIVGVAPLLGLLGAVSGLVTVFANLGASATVEDPRGIAQGIAEALSTTVVGMAIAIPSLIAHSCLSKKIEVMATEMESLMAELLAKCYYRSSRSITSQKQL